MWDVLSLGIMGQRVLKATESKGLKFTEDIRVRDIIQEPLLPRGG